MIDIGFLEVATGIGTIGGAVGCVVAVLKAHKTAIVEAVADEAKDRCDADAALKHTLNNLSTKVTGLETFRTSDVERITRLEVSMTSLKEGQNRIEHALELMKRDSADARSEIIESLREFRNVSPRTP